jgi:DNA polymerase sigma
MAVQINSMSWVVSCSTYLHARVPVVKLELDMSIPFLQAKHSQHQFAVYDPSALDCLNLSDPSSGHRINVDISVAVGEGSHGGLETTQMMRLWMESFTGLQRVLVLFKYFLHVRGYNCNFGGGIGSYGVFLMVAAYLNEFQQPEVTDLGTLFLGLLEWYGGKFDN